MSTIASDNFNRANAGTLGANWTTRDSLGVFGIVSNQASSTTDNSASYWNANAFPNDQWSQCTVTNPGGATNSGAGPSILQNTSGTDSGYDAYTATNGVGVWLANAGSYSQIGTLSATIAANAVIYMERQGSTILVKSNTVSLGTVTNSTLASGKAGIQYGQGGATDALDDWSAGDFASGGAIAGTSALVFGESGAITGAGALAGTSALLIGETGTLTGAGALAGSGALVIGETGALTGAGALAGSSALVLGESGALAGAGALAGESDLVMGAAGTLTQPSGALAGTSGISFGDNSTLTGLGALIGESDIVFAAVGALTPPVISAGSNAGGGGGAGWSPKFEFSRKPDAAELAREALEHVPRGTPLIASPLPENAGTILSEALNQRTRDAQDDDDEEAIALLLQ